MVASLTRVVTHLAMVELILCIHGVGTTINFLFKEENYTSNFGLNYKMGLEPTRNSSIRMIEMVEELAITLNQLKLDLMLMIGLLVRPT